VDENGYGLRVPGPVISPYARRGLVDHQTPRLDAYVKFIGDDFLHGERLDPKTDRRPDPRPDVRERAAILGNLVRDFDFRQKPRPPLGSCLPESDDAFRRGDARRSGGAASAAAECAGKSLPAGRRRRSRARRLNRFFDLARF
jgi:hypothetical protein